ncbi:MAG: nucleotidyltransferase domain-containing protein [Alphaproteobacteria bacterium]|jgi:predicted nucleotidyltransferase|nr:nucleotidyltransferase domain-containing protein [Alphaproteobacteria bacterium]
MRLTEAQVKAIQDNFFVSFMEGDKIWLFGSRVDDSKKGGDIDLYIETNYSDLFIVTKKEIEFIANLKKIIGDQKIDIVINILPRNQQLPIYNEARNTGIQLL